MQKADINKQKTEYNVWCRIDDGRSWFEYSLPLKLQFATQELETLRKDYPHHQWGLVKTVTVRSWVSG